MYVDRNIKPCLKETKLTHVANMSSLVLIMFRRAKHRYQLPSRPHLVISSLSSTSFEVNKKKIAVVTPVDLERNRYFWFLLKLFFRRHSLFSWFIYGCGRPLFLLSEEWLG